MHPGAVRRAAPFGITALIVFVAIGVYLAPLEPNILWLQFSFTESAFNGVLDQWQDDGTALYRSHFPADFVLLALYGAFGFLHGRQVAAAHRIGLPLATRLTWALPVAALADAAENGLHLLLSGHSPVATPVLYPVSGLAASVKWLAFLVFAASAWAARRTSAR